MRKKGRTKKVVGVSIDRDLWVFLESLPFSSKSDYVNDAIREKQMREKTPEMKVKEIQQQKRDYAIKITQLTAEEEKIKEKLR
jgi:Arc/MetJ-type ribon-helix-helix transcriptional regulator